MEARSGRRPSPASVYRHVVDHWPLVLVVTVFVATACLLPTLAPVAISDDFLYVRSVEILSDQHEVRVLPAAAMTLVFQIAWGGLFAAVFGDSPGVLRAATVTFALLGGLAMYGLCRELRVSKARSALGAAIYLFNPLSFVLGYTFMTDTYLVGLVTLAAYCYVRGLRSGVPDRYWTIAGSVAAGLAFLVRQPGILVVLGVVTYLIISGRIHRDREGARRLARVALLPLLMVAGYVVWFRFVHGIPDRSGQASFYDSLGDAGVGGTWEQAQRLTVLMFTYSGWFVLPIGLAAVWRLPALLRPFGRRRWLALAVMAAVLAGCAVGNFAPFTGRSPWAPQFFTDRGLGPVDIRGGRPEVFGSAVTGLLLGLAAVSSAVLGMALLRRVRQFGSRDGVGAGLLVATGFWLALGLLPQSMPLRNGAYSYDRYFLPLLPVAVALLLWALRPVRVLTPVAWLAVIAMGAFSIAGTHDHLTLHEAAWKVATDAHDAGVDYSDLDAGVAWDGYHLYESSYENKVTVDLKALRELAEAGFTGPFKLSQNDVGAWWIGFYTPGITSDYIVSTDRLTFYEVARRTEYSSWLKPEPQYMYLLRHPRTSGSP